MKSISVEELKEGMVVARDILSNSGYIFLSKDTVINEDLKNDLIRHNIISIMVEEPFREEISDEIRLNIDFECWDIVVTRFRVFPKEGTMMEVIFDTALKVEVSEYLE